MDKLITINAPVAEPHSLLLKDRKEIELTGVKSLDSFDSNDFLVETHQGFIHIKGSNLAILRMDTDNGQLSIRGKIDSITYISSQKGQIVTNSQKNGFMKKIFK